MYVYQNDWQVNNIREQSFLAPIKTFISFLILIFKIFGSDKCLIFILNINNDFIKHI